MEKRWVNTNQEAINKAFMSYARHTFSKYKGNVCAETYAEIDKQGRLAYVYEVSNHFQSSWSNSDVLTNDKKFYPEELDTVVRFYVGLVVPRLKKLQVAAIAERVKWVMVESHHSNSSDWYTTISFDAKSIHLTKVIEIATQYLKDNLMYREKTEYTKKALPAV
jgi:hypothetical protein